MSNRGLELLLDRVQLEACGSRRKDGQHIVIVSLVWPRPRIAERVSAKTLAFEDNAVDLRKADWIERIVFKEMIDGPFGIELGVTERMSDSEISNFFKYLGSSFVKLMGNEVEDVMGNSLAGGLVKIPFQFMSRFVADGGDKGPKMIATGSVSLHSEETWGRSAGKKVAKSKTFKVPLTAPGAVHEITRKRRQGQMQSRRRRILDAGDKNGFIEFTGKVS